MKKKIKGDTKRGWAPPVFQLIRGIGQSKAMRASASNIDASEYEWQYNIYVYVCGIKSEEREKENESAAGNIWGN